MGIKSFFRGLIGAAGVGWGHTVNEDIHSIITRLNTLETKKCACSYEYDQKHVAETYNLLRDLIDHLGLELTERFVPDWSRVPLEAHPMIKTVGVAPKKKAPKKK